MSRIVGFHMTSQKFKLQNSIDPTEILLSWSGFYLGYLRGRSFPPKISELSVTLSRLKNKIKYH